MVHFHHSEFQGRKDRDSLNIDSEEQKSRFLKRFILFQGTIQVTLIPHQKDIKPFKAVYLSVYQTSTVYVNICIYIHTNINIHIHTYTHTHKYIQIHSSSRHVMQMYTPNTQWFPQPQRSHGHIYLYSSFLISQLKVLTTP